MNSSSTTFSTVTSNGTTTATTTTNNTTSTNATSSSSSNARSEMDIFLATPLHCWAFLALNVLNTVVHSALIAVTLHIRKLRASVNQLLALESLAVVITQLTTGAVMLLIIGNRLSSTTLFVVLGVTGSVAAETGVALSLSIALDRMTTVVAPFWIMKRRPWKVTFVYSLASFAFGALLVIPMAFLKWPPIKPTVFSAYYTFCAGIVVAYVVLWVLLRRKTQIGYNPNTNVSTVSSNKNSSTTNNAQQTITRRIFRALCVIAAIDEFAWLITPICEQLLPLIQPGISTAQADIVAQYTCLVGTSLQPGVLFWLSEEYRDATNKTFRHFWRWMRKSVFNVEDPMTNTMTTKSIVITRNAIMPRRQTTI